MGRKNYLVEGASGTGKTTLCHALRRRGVRALNGDQDLALTSDPVTGEPLEAPPDLDGPNRASWLHEHHIWVSAKVRAAVPDHSEAMTFFWGGSRNSRQFLDLFDAVLMRSEGVRANGH